MRQVKSYELKNINFDEYSFLLESKALFRMRDFMLGNHFI